VQTLDALAKQLLSLDASIARLQAALRRIVVMVTAMCVFFGVLAIASVVLTGAVIVSNSVTNAAVLVEQGGLYHLPTCERVHGMRGLAAYPDRRAAESVGLSPCPDCIRGE